MSDDKTVKVNTSELRTAAGTMSDVHNRVNTVVTNLENTLNAKGYPWGHDSYGDKFTGGDSGYTKSSENLLSGAGNLDTSLEDFSSGMNDAAKKIDDMDKSGNVK